MKSIEIEAIERKATDDGLTFLEIVGMTNAEYNRHIFRRQKEQMKQEKNVQGGGAGNE